MKLPKWNGTMPSTYLFSLACFFIGYGVIRVLSLGRVTYDDREGPGVNPISKMPDGKVGLSEFAIYIVGLLALVLCVAVITTIGLSARKPPAQALPGEYTIKSRSDHLQIRP